MKNKVQSAYEKMMNDGKLTPIPKQKQRIDEIELGPNEGKKLQKRVTTLEKQVSELATKLAKVMKAMM